MVIQSIVVSVNTVSMSRYFCDFSVMLHDLHRITKIVTKFWIRIKRTDRSQTLLEEVHFSGGPRISRRGNVDLVGGRGLPRWLRFENFVSKRKNLDP